MNGIVDFRGVFNVLSGTQPCGICHLGFGWLLRLGQLSRGIILYHAQGVWDPVGEHLWPW